MAKVKLTRIERFLSKVIPEPNSGCWLWIGGLFPAGYGEFVNAPHSKLAHRISYELFIGPIPKGLHIDHLCRVRSCVNPKHLEAVTLTENLRRGIKALNGAKFQRSKTHCAHGHEFKPPNCFVNAKNERVCRACKRDTQRRFMARKRKEHNI